jgi:prepilin-type processing-associated H-X9-DG protein
MYCQDNDETYPQSIYLTNISGPCTWTSYQSIGPYQKNAQILICPSDAHPLSFKTGFAAIGVPAPCTTSPILDKVSYQANYALIDDGAPNALFGASDTRTVHTMADVEFPAETSAYSDSVVTLPGGTAGFSLFSSPVQSRHNLTVNSNWADGHAKAVHVKPATNSSGTQLGGNQLDGQPILAWIITDAGPYQNRAELWGVPFKNPDGSWGRRN